jgi:phospholipase C
MSEPAGLNRSVSRRRFLQGSAALGAALTLPRGLDWATARAASPTPLRHPGSLPNPHQPPGTDLLPQIEHIVVVMQENHSYDNYLGMLRRGDGFTLGHSGVPTNTNLDRQGTVVHAFSMPTACQANGPSQSWNNSHRAYNDGRNDGFVVASGPVAMGYWNETDIPFYYSLAKTFPLCDRWFSSTLAQTYPNRRFLLAGTAYGDVSTDTADILSPSPPNGTIMDQLNAHQIPWLDYYTSLPSVGLFKGPTDENRAKLVSIGQFFTDAAAGTLPGVSWVEPQFDQQSEEDPQDIQQGEHFVSQVVDAVMHGPAWDKTILVWTYDEGGGYYDHVPPPAAIKPDDIPPRITVPPDQPGVYDRYGFRVPAAIVSPYARRDYVSHVVHDHTSILKLIETKWNLPALTFRDANADNLLDSLDFHHPAFLEPPSLAAPGLTTTPSACRPGDPGMIPPPGALTTPSTKVPTT